MNRKLFFEPGSIAVAGASSKKEKAGYAIISSLIQGGYTGKIFAVNPTESTVLGIACRPDLKSLDQAPDLVFFKQGIKLPDRL